MHLRHCFSNSSRIIFKIWLIALKTKRCKYCQECIIRDSFWDWPAFQNEGIEVFEDFSPFVHSLCKTIASNIIYLLLVFLWANVYVELTFTVTFSFQMYTTFWKKASFGMKLFKEYSSCLTECYSFQNFHLGGMSSFLLGLQVKSLCGG